jgi:uncharacterized membrane protein YdbT with pleckstrin-like domain
MGIVLIIIMAVTLAVGVWVLYTEYKISKQKKKEGKE